MPTTLTPGEAFPPGEYLRDELEERGWTGEEFAEIIGRPVQTVSEILNGRKQIVSETALAIADALGTSAELWVNLLGAPLGASWLSASGRASPTGLAA